MQHAESNWMKVAEVQLVYNNPVKMADRPVISNPKDAYPLLRQCWNEQTIGLFEEFKVLLTNNSNRVLGLYEVSKRGTGGTVVDVKLVFVTALKAASNTIILAHNHPSGMFRPARRTLN